MTAIVAHVLSSPPETRQSPRNVIQLTCPQGQKVLSWRQSSGIGGQMGKATAVANPNIALIKYWGKSDEALNLPANASLSMNLAALTTVTTVDFGSDLESDIVAVDGRVALSMARTRVVAQLDRVRAMSGINHRARVASNSDFPSGTGLASSASASAALSLAAALAAKLELDDETLSRLARLGSGSACRSVPAGFVEWSGDSDLTSIGRQVAPAAHWDLTDVIAIVSRESKAVGSREGHRSAPTSPFHAVRLAAVPERLSRARAAIVDRDLATLGAVAEADALAMHAVMMTSQPSLLYWVPGTVAVLSSLRKWRMAGLDCYFTVDAGPNVHCLCDAASARDLTDRLGTVAGVEEIVVSGPGEGARRVDFHLF
ncbi:diphosphomevalonate decarboxylase [Chloroflexota bacterium]